MKIFSLVQKKLMVFSVALSLFTVISQTVYSDPPVPQQPYYYGNQVPNQTYGNQQNQGGLVITPQGPVLLPETQVNPGQSNADRLFQQNQHPPR